MSYLLPLMSVNSSWLRSPVTRYGPFGLGMILMAMQVPREKCLCDLRTNKCKWLGTGTQGRQLAVRRRHRPFSAIPNEVRDPYSYRRAALGATKGTGPGASRLFLKSRTN